jgi:hypothetical protein
MSKTLRSLAAAAIIVAGACFIAAEYFVVMNDKAATSADYISYWAAGQQLVHQADPYDIVTVRRIECTAGRETSEPVLIMRNPPLAFFLAAPLGFASPKIGLIAWLIFLLGCLSVSIYMLWIIHGRPNTRLHLLGYAFAPAVACTMAGQFGIFLLLGVVLFLLFHRSHPFLAGMALLLCALKPHLFPPFAVALFLWIVMRKSYAILGGFIVAVATSCAFSYWLDPHGWPEYLRMMRAGGATNEVVPTLSAYFRLILNRNVVWLEFVPQAVACVWAVWYFLTRRAHWQWTNQGLVVLLVGAMCTPYGFLTDETMLLPAVLAGLYTAIASRRSPVPLIVMSAAALIEFLAGVSIVSPYFLWTTPACLLWYFYAKGDLDRRLIKMSAAA